MFHEEEEEEEENRFFSFLSDRREHHRSKALFQLSKKKKFFFSHLMKIESLEGISHMSSHLSFLTTESISFPFLFSSSEVLRMCLLILFRSQSKKNE